VQALNSELPRAVAGNIQRSSHQLERAKLRIELLDPKLVLKRGFAWLSDLQGQPITAAQMTHIGQPVRATLADGEVDLTVAARRLI
jgi:exodeoxyribonuclease VII large subunit